jgi:DNA-binding NarL/FixJ family response regulator
MTAEITIEHASGTGRWDEGLALAEQVIPVARAIAPQSLLPRLLVWTGLMVLARDETERARALFEEAWRLSEAEHASEGLGRSGLELANVHNAILAHTGMGHYWLARGAWQRALTYGERGLAIADRYGYIAWAIHRLIPLILEAGLWLQQYDRVEELTQRLRTQSAAFDHRLGLAWAKAADALVARLRDHHPDAARQILEAADDLDAVPFVLHAARLRGNAAQLLEADGDASAAVRELRKAHDVFARIGAERELRETRSQLRSLGVRLPPRTATTGVGALTGRELEIARAVANRLSNKQIGATLDISARTVSTHLSNIFQKLGIDSRGALADRVRDDPQFQVS